jgi:hypothetical protein
MIMTVGNNNHNYTQSASYEQWKFDNGHAITLGPELMSRGYQLLFSSSMVVQLIVFLLHPFFGNIWKVHEKWNIREYVHENPIEII